MSALIIIYSQVIFTTLKIIHVKTEQVQLNVRKLKILAGSVIVKWSGFQDAFVDLKTLICDLRFEFIHSIFIKSHGILLISYYYYLVSLFCGVCL